MPVVALLLSLMLVSPPGANSPPGPGGSAATPPDREYRVFVGSEATDRISLVVFGPEGARVEREFTVGIFQTDLDAPHGLAMSPDGQFLYVTTGHGRPWGNLWKLDPANGRVVGRVELGHFPASLDISPDGAFAYVANFNLHGDMVPSSVSVVATGPMVEVSRLTTCTMPHGSRISADGSRQYSTCMMDDLVVEVDAWGLEVERHFSLARGEEHGMMGAPGAHGHGAPTPGGPMAAHTMPQADCSPTWVHPSADGTSLFVACNASNELVEVSVGDWTLERRIPAGDGIYTFAVTRDGTRIVATNKRGQSVSVFDTGSGDELARIPTTRPVVHGVVISPDDLYAFVSVEGVGSEPGTVEIIDLTSLDVVASVDVPQMASGITFWR